MYPPYMTDQGAIGDTCWNNAVQYSTPDFGGLSASVMYGLGNQADGSGQHKYSAQFLYFHGPFAATGVYQYANFNVAGGDLGSLIAGGENTKESTNGLKRMVDTNNCVVSLPAVNVPYGDSIPR